MDKVVTTYQGEGISFQHLRRLAKESELSTQVRGILDPTQHEASCVETENANLSSRETAKTAESHVGNQRCDGADIAGTMVKKTDESSKNPLYFLICSSQVLPLEEINACFSTLAKIIPHVLPTVPTIHKILVPLHPPTSVEQAREWSQLYWPTVWKKHNPNGPQPSTVTRATQSIADRVGSYMALAKQAAHEAQDAGLGKAYGAVVVNPFPPQVSNDKPSPAVVVAAGDTRWAGCPSTQREGLGNPMAHAVMRAIALVARKRRELASQSRVEPQLQDDGLGKVFQDFPILSVEQYTLSKDTLAPNGYLCTSMEIYVTHEPCIMCSMAILHSRFDKVVFARRMPQTGAMAAEREQGNEVQQPEAICGEQRCGAGDSGYGLFWRDELNWKLLAWQFIELDMEKNQEEELKGLHRIHA